MNLYRCSVCESQYESTKPIKTCAKCKKRTLYEATHFKTEDGKMVLYKYVEVPYIAIKLGDSEVKTLDHLGRRNWERDTKNGIIGEKEEKKRETDKKKGKKVKSKEKPWWRDTDKPDPTLAKLNDKQKENYIMTGKK